MKTREQWGSKLGFILAASGSAVGIGNIWKFPYIAGENGGGAFTLIYLLCILIVGLTIEVVEFAIGRNTQRSPVGAFKKIAPNSNWKWVGFIGVLSSFVILSYYGVVGGWILKYIFISISGGFESLSNDPDKASKLFNTFIGTTWSPIVFMAVFNVLCVYVIINGVKDGIENWSKIMMPIITVLLLVLAIRGLTLPGGTQGLKFLFLPRFEDLTASAVVLALGHSFFTLSLGMGNMITYGSYLGKEQNLLRSALWVIALDTAVALLAGVAIFTSVFATGADPAGGAGLVFNILPSIFPQLAYGSVWGTIFFALLFMAALTSAISILEVVTASLIDEKGWSRNRATILFGIIVTIVGVFCSFSMGGGINIAEYFGDTFQHYLGTTFFDVMDNLSAKYLMPLGGTLTAIFVIVKWGVPSFIAEVGTSILDKEKDKTIVTIFLVIAAGVAGFILLNELIETITGSAIIG
mgnify:CR=1 FL=1|jgi:NSS family neurotransmitter:Na+ symporter